MIRRMTLVARTIFIEAIRRKEIYVIVLVTVALLFAASFIRFFDLKSLEKFYTEVSLKVMSVATMLTVIVLGARQLPREFERRTIYPLLAKPITRFEFMMGKFLGVVSAGVFCLAMFMLIFLFGRLLNGETVPLVLFTQFVYLQILLIGIIAALSFLLSLVAALDATITIVALIYMLGHVLTNALIVIYDFTEGVGRVVLKVLNYVVPQPALFDLSGRMVHHWAAPSAMAMLALTGYALLFIIPFLGVSFLLLRRRPL